MATNSSGIAACCQRPDEDEDAYLYPVKLGVVKEGVNLSSAVAEGRITFSTDVDISPPVDGMLYEQAAWLPRRKKLDRKSRRGAEDEA